MRPHRPDPSIDKVWLLSVKIQMIAVFRRHFGKRALVPAGRVGLLAYGGDDLLQFWLQARLHSVHLKWRARPTRGRASLNLNSKVDRLVPDLFEHIAGGRAPPARALLAAALDVASVSFCAARGHVTIETAYPTPPQDCTRCFEAQETDMHSIRNKHKKNSATRKAKIKAEPVRKRATWEEWRAE